MNSNNSKNNVYLDGMIGLATGDALGCPVQFLSRYQIAARPQGPVAGMEGYGTYHKPAGTWTDDTSMALASLDSIIHQGCVDHADTMENFRKWLYEGKYTPFGEAFDEGITCSGAISRYSREKDISACGKTGEHANGNGALMRILPVCLYFITRRNCICTSDDEAIAAIHQSTALTHNHLRAQIASGLYYFMAKEIVDGLHFAAADSRGAGSNTGLQNLLQKGLDEGFAYYRRDLRNLSQVTYYQRLYSLDAFKEVPGCEIRSGGYVVDSLEAAVWCLVTTDSFKDCLLKAVNLGDDTDTVAAIAGGLAGLYYGISDIPREWLNTLQAREYLEAMCEKADQL